MLGRLATLRPRLGLPKPKAPPAPTGSRRAVAARNTNPWLGDKSLYPMLAIVGATVAFAAWFGTMYLYKSPEAQTPMRRRTSQHIAHKRPDEGIPFMDEMYKKSDQLTKGIYRVTIKDKEGAKEGEEMGKRN